MIKNAADAPNPQAESQPQAEADTRYPKDPADWRSNHYLALMGRIERAWDACPPELQPNLRAMVLPMFGGPSK